MDKAKLRALLYAKDKEKAQSGMPSNALSVPQNKSTPMSMNPDLGKSSVPKMRLPNPTAAPSVIGSVPKLPKPARFARMKKMLKPAKEF